jgi:PIN domain nuclease of toxin-antitoxin system
MSVVADTHAAGWWLAAREKLSPAARAALELASQGGSTVFISSVTVVEVCYLVEKGKLSAEILAKIDAALDDPTVALTAVSLDAAVARHLRQISRGHVPDMPDRIIAATASYLGLPLVSRDGKIRSAQIQTIW